MCIATRCVFSYTHMCVEHVWLRGDEKRRRHRRSRRNKDPDERKGDLRRDDERSDDRRRREKNKNEAKSNAATCGDDRWNSQHRNEDSFVATQATLQMAGAMCFVSLVSYPSIMHSSLLCAHYLGELRCTENVLTQTHNNPCKQHE